jgi:salicylate hydroxylase
MTDLRRFAYQIATEIGVQVRPNSEVISIDVDTRSVSLVSGETLSADVLIGADGVNGISRATLSKGQCDEPMPTGMALYT